MAMFRPVTVITGASAGIGRELARVFAGAGHEVLLVARREPQLAALADEITNAGHPTPHVVAVDLTRGDGTALLGHEVAARGLEPAYVVNNAGFGLFGPAIDLERAEQLAMIDLNIRTLTDLSLRWGDSLVRHKGGILNVASIAAFLPGPGMAVYYATKAYVLSFSEALHHEFARDGVRVTALCPGPVRTEFQARAGIGAEQFSRWLARTPEQVAREGFDGLMRGRRVVVPGFANRIVTLLPRLLSRGAVLRLMGRRFERGRPSTRPEVRWRRRAS